MKTKPLSRIIAEEGVAFHSSLPPSRETAELVREAITLCLAIAALRHHPYRIPMALLAGAVAALPLGLHAIAWDTSRIWTYPLGNALLLLWAATQSSGHTEEKPSVWLLATATISLAVAATSNTPLMDGLADRGWHLMLAAYVPAVFLVAWKFEKEKS